MRMFDLLKNGESDDILSQGESLSPAHKPSHESWLPKFHFDLPREFPELFAPEFTTDADTTHDIWHHEPALAPLDFDVVDAMA